MNEQEIVLALKNAEEHIMRGVKIPDGESANRMFKRKEDLLKQLERALERVKTTKGELSRHNKAFATFHHLVKVEEREPCEAGRR